MGKSSRRRWAKFQKFLSAYEEDSGDTFVPEPVQKFEKRPAVFAVKDLAAAFERFALHVGSNGDGSVEEFLDVLQDWLIERREEGFPLDVKELSRGLSQRLVPSNRMMAELYNAFNRATHS